MVSWLSYILAFAMARVPLRMPLAVVDAYFELVLCLMFGSDLATIAIVWVIHSILHGWSSIRGVGARSICAPVLVSTFKIMPAHEFSQRLSVLRVGKRAIMLPLGTRKPGHSHTTDADEIAPARLSLVVPA